MQLASGSGSTTNDWNETDNLLHVHVFDLIADSTVCKPKLQATLLQTHTYGYGVTIKQAFYFANLHAVVVEL